MVCATAVVTCSLYRLVVRLCWRGREPLAMEWFANFGDAATQVTVAQRVAAELVHSARAAQRRHAGGPLVGWELPKVVTDMILFYVRAIWITAQRLEEKRQRSRRRRGNYQEH